MKRTDNLLCKRGIIAVILVLMLCGCNKETKMEATYSFAHRIDEVESIEILLNKNTDAFSSDEEAFICIRSLEKSEIVLFLKSVYDLETSYCISPPLRGHGAYIARVTYANGDVEMLGTEHIEFIPSGAARTGVGAYYFTQYEEFEQLILSYSTPSS